MAKNIVPLIVSSILLVILCFAAYIFIEYIIAYCTVPGPHSFMRLSDAILWSCITVTLAIGCIVLIVINAISIRKKAKKKYL